MPESPQSRTPVQLRQVEEGDLPIFFDHQGDPDANLMAAFPARERGAFMVHWESILRDDAITKRTILFEGRVAGNIVCFQFAGEPHVGYWLGKEYWGRGVATRAVSEFLGLVRARPIYARVAKHNVASRRVLEKCGFTICGEGRVPSDAHTPVVEEFIMRLERKTQHGGSSG